MELCIGIRALYRPSLNTKVRALAQNISDHRDLVKSPCPLSTVPGCHLATVRCLGGEKEASWEGVLVSKAIIFLDHCLCVRRIAVPFQWSWIHCRQFYELDAAERDPCVI